MCSHCFPSPDFDESQSEAFSQKALDMLNLSGMAFMTSIGHRTGLFDSMENLPPSTSREIAERAGLNERYVREWLAGMLAGGVVAYDPETKKYSLPKEHSSFLTRSAGADNIAAIAQYFAVLGSVEDKIVDCFQQGGGVPYSAYPRFQEVMAADSENSVVSSLFDQILPLVPGLTRRLERGIEVLDVGFGRGKALLLMAQRFPNSRFTGYEISEDGIEYAREQAEAGGLKNVEFLFQDASTFEDEERFDFVCTFDAIHDQADPLAVLKNIRRTLKPDGVYLMQDIDAHTDVEKNVDHPLGTLLYTVSTMHCMSVSLAAGGLGLGTMWGVELAEEMLRDAGFRSLQVERLPHDIMNCYFVCKKE